MDRAEKTCNSGSNAMKEKTMTRLVTVLMLILGLSAPAALVAQEAARDPAPAAPKGEDGGDDAAAADAGVHEAGAKFDYGFSGMLARDNRTQLAPLTLASGKAVHVVVTAGIGRDGSLLNAKLSQSMNSYVPGVTDVVVSGRVTKTSIALGKITVGRIVVDYSQLLSKQNVSIGVGDVVTVSGVRPGTTGEVLASRVILIAR